MKASKSIKAALVGLWVALGFFYLTSSSLVKGNESDQTKKAVPAADKYKPEDFVGSETCKACHADQFANYSRTLHGRLAAQPNWKGKMQGCETCHGPGKLHVEGGGDKTKIRTFKGESQKQISENCLQCHAGREEHNNYKRGEHWRNDVGCTQCHSPHGELKVARDAVPNPSPKSISRRRRRIWAPSLPDKC
jgi:nitrate/TMAO reductase-like tetraheme cytochrome c subunit